MRVEFTNLGLEPPDKSKPGRAGQSGTAASVPVTSENTSAKASTGDNASVGVDHARFSFDHARVASLRAKVLSAPEVRQGKVEPLQESVANGSYAVDTRKVADAIATELERGRVR